MTTVKHHLLSQNSQEAAQTNIETEYSVRIPETMDQNEDEIHDLES